MDRIVRYFAKLPLTAMLKQPELRRRVIFELEQNYYQDLNISVPLDFCLICPITLADHWHSFVEIFVERVYASAFNSIALPSRWVDIGCHAGYFSLFLIGLRAKQNRSGDFRCLLIDADPRVKLAVKKLVSLNRLEERMTFQHGAVAKGHGEVSFSMRSVMSSAVTVSGQGDGQTATVPIASQEDLLLSLAPPYDLIKVDIEGMEHEFFSNYDRIIRASSYLLVEWHSWHTGGGGASQICKLAEAQGLKLILEPVAPHTVQVDGKSEQCGTFLFGRVNT